MRKALMIGSLTAFIAVAAIAAPRRDVVPPVPSEEVAGGPGEEHLIQPVEGKSHNCPCGDTKPRGDTKPPKRMKR